MKKVDEAQLKAWAQEHDLVTEIEHGGNFFYFKKPSKTVVGIAMAEEAKGNVFGWPDVLIVNCLLGGDVSELKDDIGFLEGLRQKVESIVGAVPCTIERDGDSVAVNWEDGKMALLRKVDRTLYKNVILMAKEGNLPGAFQMAYKQSFIEGDDKLLNDMSYLFALIKKQDEWFGMVNLTIKNYSRNWSK